MVSGQPEVDWRESWGPWGFGNVQRESQEYAPTTRKYVHRGSDQLSHEAMTVLGTQFMPNCDQVWRQPGNIPNGAAQL